MRKIRKDEMRGKRKEIRTTAGFDGMLVVSWPVNKFHHPPPAAALLDRCLCVTNRQAKGHVRGSVNVHTILQRSEAEMGRDGPWPGMQVLRRWKRRLPEVDSKDGGDTEDEFVGNCR